MAIDFKTLLSKPAETAVKPPNLPAGSYEGMLGSFQFHESKNERKTPYVEFQCSFHNALDDVDQERLAKIDLSKRKLTKKFFLTDDSRYRVIDLAKSCGISVNGRTDGEVIADLQNQNVLFSVIEKNTTDGEDTYNEIGMVKGSSS